MPGPAHRLRRLKQEGTHPSAYLGPVHNWDCLHLSSDASMFHKGQLGRSIFADSPLPPISSSQHCITLPQAASAAPGLWSILIRTLPH